MRETLFLGRDDVRGLLTMEMALEVVERAFAAHGRGETRMPAKIYLDLPEVGGDFRAMPAHLPSLGATGVKWVSSHSRNPARGLPAVLAVLILSDPETAEPLAVMDATHLTLMRTGAAGGLATKWLARADTPTVAFVGAGVQSFAQLDAIRLVRKITTVKIHDPIAAAATRLAAHATASGITAEILADAASAVHEADVIVSTTPSRVPLVDHADVRAGTHLNAIGADAPGKQELDPALLRAAQIFVDDEEQAFHSGEINVPLASGALERDSIAGTLGAVIAGRAPGRADDTAITVFDSTGLAVQDMACARAVYDAALAAGVGRSLPLTGT